jgi:hypothetical protein
MYTGHVDADRGGNRPMTTVPDPMVEGLKNQDGSCAKQSSESDSLIINEVQLILAEKRTSLASMRTGIAVFVLPLSLISLLIATSKYYDVVHVLHLLLPLALMLAALIILGGYLIVRALRAIHHHDRLIHQLKTSHSKLSNLIN